MMDSLLQDARYCWRMSRRRPLVTGVAIGSLALGISLATVVFSLLDAVLLRPLPVEDPDRLAVLLETRPDGVNHNFSNPDFRAFEAGQGTLAGLTAYSGVTLAWNRGTGSQVVAGELVSGSHFTLLGVRMRFGRGLSADDDRAAAAPAAVVSDALWREWTGGSEDFTPLTIVLNAQPFPVVGVAAPPFRGMEVGRDARVWLPVHAKPLIDAAQGANVNRRTVSWLTVVARTRAAGREAAAQDLNLVEADLASAQARPRRTLTLAPGRLGDSVLPAAMASPLLILLGAALFVFLIACANVANLLLARATERGRELAVRAALGAGRARLARLVLLEALLLSVAGAALGLLMARWMATLAVPLIARFGEPVTLDLSLDWRIAAFVSAMAAGAALTAGLAPIATVSRRSLAAAVGAAGRAVSATRSSLALRNALNVAQFALSLALIVAAALLARTLFNLGTLATGFDIDHVALVEADPEQAQFDPRRAQDYVDQVLDRVARLPGVRAAAWARVIPLGFGGSRTSITVPGYAPASGEDMEINFNTVSSGYFDAMGIGLIDGRAFDARDDAGGRRVAVVNRTMAARYWRGQPAVGRTFALAPTEPPIEVVGVVGDVKYRMLREEAGPSFYLPVSQERARAGVFHVRTHGDPADLLPAIRRAATETDPTVPIAGLRTLRDQARINATDERLAMTIGFALGGAALLLAAVGLYGSMAFAVGLRTREMGVRLALGATARDLRRLVLAHGLRLSAAGSAAGLLLAVPMARTIEARLFGVRAADLPTLVGAAAVLAAVALAACWAPARRAGRVDPAGALRVD